LEAAILSRKRSCSISEIFSTDNV